jgi:hypothetical protein
MGGCWQSPREVANLTERVDALLILSNSFDRSEMSASSLLGDYGSSTLKPKGFVGFKIQEMSYK